MAAPNLNSPTTVTGKTAWSALANTNEATILTNAASSNTAVRLTSLVAANISSTLAADITVRIYNSASAGTAYPLFWTVTVPAKASIILVDTNSRIWLEEDTRVTVQASAANNITCTLSYEVVS